MITILKSDEAPVFSSIAPEQGAAKVSPIVTFNPAGKIIYSCLEKLCNDFPVLRVFRRIAMPDHIHFELFVTERTEMPLGSIVAVFKSACTNAFKAEFPQSELALKNLPIFKPGFNDKIAFRAGAKDAFYNYIADNPRRYLVKKLYPDYFYHKLLLVVAGRRLGLYGNIFLLDHPVKSFVKISRDKSKMPDLDNWIKEWNETIRCGGVLVSPFINTDEKEFRDEAIKNGSGLILVVDYRFSERKKPYKELFDLCAEGRLLIVSTEEFAEPPQKMHYAHAQELNAIALKIAHLPPRAAVLRRR